MLINMEFYFSFWTGVRSLVGPLTRTDDQVYLDFGGQKVITSSSQFESLIKGETQVENYRRLILDIPNVGPPVIFAHSWTVSFIHAND